MFGQKWLEFGNGNSRLERERYRKFYWLRGLDLNQRPLGYEPNELPDCSTPRCRHLTLLHGPRAVKGDSGGRGSARILPLASRPQRLQPTSHEPFADDAEASRVDHPGH